MKLAPRWLEAFDRQLAVLEAEEALATIAQVAAGSGVMAERQQRDYLRALKRAARGGKREPAVKATVASLAQMGIKRTVVPAKEKPALLLPDGTPHEPGKKVREPDG